MASNPVVNNYQLAAMVVDQAITRSLLIPNTTYRYEITATDSSGLSTQVNEVNTVSVPLFKRAMLESYLALSMVADYHTGLSVRAATLRLIPLSLQLAALEATEIAAACGFYHLATTPDPNFQSLAEFNTISSPSVNSLPEGTAKQLALSWLRVLAYQRALDTSLDRYEGAQIAGDQVWMQRQLVAAQGFHGELVQHLSASATLSAALSSELEAAGVVISEGDRAAIQAELQHGSSPNRARYPARVRIWSARYRRLGPDRCSTYRCTASSVAAQSDGKPRRDSIGHE